MTETDVKFTRKMKSWGEGVANPSKTVRSFTHLLLGLEEGKQHETQVSHLDSGPELCARGMVLSSASILNQLAMIPRLSLLEPLPQPPLYLESVSGLSPSLVFK